MTAGKLDPESLKRNFPTIAAVGTGVLAWGVTGSALVGLISSAMAVTGCVLASSIALHGREQQAQSTGTRTSRASQLSAMARCELNRLISRAADAKDDEVNFRAMRLGNTATLLIEALQEAPGRFGELQAHLGPTLSDAADVTERYVTNNCDNPDAGTRNAFLRYLQEIELKFEYAARGCMFGEHGRAG